MHINFTFKSNGNLELPMHYNHILQAALYNSIEPELAAFLHDKGYQSGNRSFKLFSFSRLTGRFNIIKEKGTIKFLDEVKLTVSSPVEEFCQSIANGMLTKGHIRFGNCEVEVEKMVVKQFKIEGERAVFRTLSPVVVYSTFLRPDGRKYTAYFQPGDPDYNELVENNLRKKFQALYGREATDGEVKVKKVGQMRLHVMKYKDTVIKGYSGRIALTGSQELLQMAVDAGVGAKNGQGFGCIEVLERR